MILAATLFAFVLQGYHPGAEDDGVYLTAIKRHLVPSLYPFNASFFTLQLQATVFDKAVALLAMVTHLPLAYICLLLQLTAIALLLGGCRQIVQFCFGSFRAQLAGVLTIACLLTLSVAGTALYISDEHLHPRLLATDAIVFAIACTQRRRTGRAVLLLFVAMLFHPIMGMFGISFCLLYRLWDFWASRAVVKPVEEFSRAAAVPGAWLFAPATPAWREAVAEHSYYSLAGWHWYEWLGAVAPPLLVWMLARLGQKRENPQLATLATTLTIFSILQLLVALCMLLPPGLERLMPLQPMRYLHLTFLLMALLGGAALGEYVLRARALLWVAVFVPLAAINGYAQRLRYPATENLELPWSAPGSDWLKAFAWIRTSTPQDAVFAMDPHYLSLPGEDNHSFRALAERSSLVDDEKDAAVVTQVPALADRWLMQHDEQAGWRGWTQSDFDRLAQTTPVRWVIVSPAQARELRCPYANATVSVCELQAAVGAAVGTSLHP